MKARSTIVLIDNSKETINGDFYPDRLAAQRICVERLFDNQLSVNKDCELGIITMSSPENGIRISLSENKMKILSVLGSISRGDHLIDITKSIKCAIIALSHSRKPRNERRILVFVASPHLLSIEEKNELRILLKESSVILDVVIISEFVNDTKNLRDLSRSSSNATFLELLQCHSVISDYVLASHIGVFKEETHHTAKKKAKREPFLMKIIESNPAIPMSSAFGAIFDMCENVGERYMLPIPKKEPTTKKKTIDSKEPPRRNPRRNEGKPKDPKTQ